MNRIRRSAEMARSVALTGGAALGAAVLLAMLAGAALGIRPVVITSGSMEPGIGTGAVVLVRTVPALSLIHI